MSFSNNILIPSDYEKSAVLAQEVGQELLERLDWMTLQPEVIVDAGCGPGTLTRLLKKRYPEARVIGVDSSERMIAHAKERIPGVEWLEEDCANLSLQNQSVDLIYANFLLPWQADFMPLLREWQRILRPDGLLLFTALGPDTLGAWRDIFAADSLPTLIDMHDIGDALVHSGFADPVLDVAHYTLNYRSFPQLLNELRESGLWISSALATPISLQKDEAYAITFEVIYAHAFGKAQSMHVNGEVRIPLAELRQAVKK